VCSQNDQEANVGTVVLGLQGGIASGSETTFDQQPMQPGVHLRWSFQPELGFPPGGFWLCRRVAKKDDKTIAVPQAWTNVVATQTSLAAVTAGPGNNQFEAVASTPCGSVTLAGCAADGCDEILVETFCRNKDGAMESTGRQVIRVRPGAFRITVAARDISCVRVSGAGRVDECGCNIEPPTDCGCGGTGGGGTNPPCNGQPGWGPPGTDGFQCWGVPFTLPITNANWPARYYGARDPLTTPDSTMAAKDVQEALRRLGTLKLSNSLSTAQQHAELVNLRAELKRLVEGFPATLLPDVPLQTSPAGANAPSLNLSLMQELLLLALDPYFARVLGLYFVDDQVAPGVSYDYFLIGFWGNTPAQAQVLFPGLAPAAPLARGSAQFDGMTIQPGNGNTSLWRWLQNAGNPFTDPSAPPAVATNVNAALSGVAAAQIPQAILALYSPTLFWGFSTPAPSVTIVLPQSVMSVDVQAAGVGTITALSNGTSVAVSDFDSATLVSTTVSATSAAAPIDTLQITGVTQSALNGIVVSVGSLTLHPLNTTAVGIQYALLGPPGPITPVPAPGQPIATFVRRQADVDPATLDLVPHSMISVEWPAPAATAAQTTGNPMTDPLALPPPDRPIGFVADRQDSGKASSLTQLKKWISAASSPTPQKSKITTPRLFRFLDKCLPDPAGGYSYRIGGFDIFGAVGQWSGWTPPLGVEKVAAAPTNLRIIQFDNSTKGGGAPSADGSAWVGGTLLYQANWSGASFVLYPDIQTAQATVQSVDIATGAATGVLATQNFTLPARKAKQVTVTAVNVAPAAVGAGNVVTVQTTPALPALQSTDPAAMLIFTLPDGTTERYVTRPAAPSGGGAVVATLQAGSSARIVATPNSFVGQTAYLILGYSVQPTLAVPLNIPIAQTSARGEIYLQGSTKNPFDPSEQIVDPNGVNPIQPEPTSVTLKFTGAQRLVPPAPPTPQHDVNHVYYNPADYTGMASATLPFNVSGGAGISGYILQRAAVRSILLADVARRIALNNAADPNPVLSTPRPDLVAWINALTQWLADYNTVAGTNWTMANVLQSDSTAQRLFVEHFYGGLLDDELRALADLSGNSRAYANVNPKPLPPSANALTDSVNGTGYGRTVYQLATTNAAGSISGMTGSIGPYYTRVVAPPRPPVLYKVQPTQAAILVAWALDTNPDVAAYIVYRASSVAGLSDLRYFGPNPAYPSSASSLAQIAMNNQANPGLSYGAGQIDPRIIALVPDPRIVARDYQGSDMGEIVLPAGAAPDSVNGIYRLDQYDPTKGPLGQVVFNYWTPPATGGIAQIVTSNPPYVRLTGLRIGLGRGVPVVVVATWKGQAKTFGVVPVRRAGYTDGVLSTGTPADPNTLKGVSPPSVNLPNAYAVVSVDIFGNLSAPSTPFAAQMLAMASAS
jgi:hypothetical protein